ncbi:hypothetical protein DRP77_08360 [Candidatus Poribacteria bacterium]|nr:MAG: hypothetical protein DRP77_08360 [Candidatus Poribacteria bacterium]
MRFAILALLAALMLGCGSASVTKDEGEGEGVKLAVEVQVSKTRVAPGETVKLVAIVKQVKAETVKFNWINVTKLGQLIGDPESNSIEWRAPESIEEGAVKVEVIQLVVTAISHVISATEKGVEVRTEVATETKTIPITIVRP